jgi:hypothetical protein
MFYSEECDKLLLEIQSKIDELLKLESFKNINPWMTFQETHKATVRYNNTVYNNDISFLYEVLTALSLDIKKELGQVEGRI